MKACFSAMLAAGLALATTDAGAGCLPVYGDMPDAPIGDVFMGVSNLPEIIVGSLDQPNCVGDGQNSFAFTNAFKFDHLAWDADTPLDELRWSFDEGDDPTSPTTQWYKVNGVGPIHLGDAAMEAEEAFCYPEHIDPGTSDIRAASPYASFEDISWTPEHQAGKTIRFYISDGINVAGGQTIIRSVDNVCDSLSGGSQIGCLYEDQLTTSGGWESYVKEPSAADVSYAGYSGVDYDAGNSALRCRIQSDPGTAGTDAAPVNGSVGLFRAAGWKTKDVYAQITLPYAALGSDNVARTKWFVYATGNTPAQVNTIPATRMQTYNRFVMLTTLEVFTHVNDGTAITSGDTLGQDLAPSTNPAAPSLYRSDYDPVDAPFLVANGEHGGHWPCVYRPGRQTAGQRIHLPDGSRHGVLSEVVCRRQADPDPPAVRFGRWRIEDHGCHPGGRRRRTVLAPLLISV